MKPWEGKHWNSCQEKLHLEIENWKHTSNFRNGVIYTLNILEDALQKDWEEKQLKSVIYHEEWGGCLRAVIDGNPQNIADHLNKKYTETVECAQTAEKEKSGHQESSEFCPTCGTALGEPWEYERFRPSSLLKSEKEDRLTKNLMMSISMQRDEMDELKRKFHDEKKAESFTSSNDVLPEQPPEISIKGDGFYETVAQDDGSILVRPKWIPVSERLPKLNQVVLVFHCPYIGFDRRTDPKDGNVWASTEKEHITHWMALPPPPEES